MLQQEGDHLILCVVDGIVQRRASAAVPHVDIAAGRQQLRQRGGRTGRRGNMAERGAVFLGSVPIAFGGQRHGERERPGRDVIGGIQLIQRGAAIRILRQRIRAVCDEQIGNRHHGFRSIRAAHIRHPWDRASDFLHR